MAAAVSRPTNRGWLRRLLSGRPHQAIGGAADPYLRRWYLIPRNPVLNVYLHQFLRSDDDRALHDHPWWFVSLILRGRYDEVTDRGTRRRRPGSIAFRRAETRHRVELLPDAAYEAEASCWTLIVTGRRARVWGFWCEYVGDLTGRRRERFVPWQEWDNDAGCGEAA
ncbi:hypothetical protein [Mycolicibacterium sp.]|uniref:hypothetical protein n=1 Tax=Mycolicibacterium sp. TaxID=2320850 RepID=UPI00355CD3DE